MGKHGHDDDVSFLPDLFWHAVQIICFGECFELIEFLHTQQPSVVYTTLHLGHMIHRPRFRAILTCSCACATSRLYGSRAISTRVFAYLGKFLMACHLSS
ncbi:hypothetical protein PoB_005072900 [Plakobranchus ocellatus]|uniref:Uncharacterized protein n=1 Tax=Plakobranchus ocellatus TaxID=259542 RepID=A0AAV4C0L2_9GAST|nr:hypothetical protein PoB_005072900 [Plakobranchus ocellatus]